MRGKFNWTASPEVKALLAKEVGMTDAVLTVTEFTLLLSSKYCYRAQIFAIPGAWGHCLCPRERLRFLCCLESQPVSSRAHWREWDARKLRNAKEAGFLGFVLFFFLLFETCWNFFFFLKYSWLIMCFRCTSKQFRFYVIIIYSFSDSFPFWTIVRYWI